MNSFTDYFITNLPYILTLLFNHIQYTLIAVVVAILIGVPLGIMIFNSKTLDKPVLNLANLVQAIPSLAILGFIVPYFGIGASTAIFMVVLYSLLPILKNTYTGLSNINRDTLEAARGIGMKNSQILMKVQIPLALPVIMAGVRISSVTAVGLMTIAAYIGADVLGTLVISGIQTDNSAMILAGAIPACILALSMDFFMSKVEKAVTPVSLQLTATNLTNEAINSIRGTQRRTKFTMVALASIILGVVIIGNLQEEPDIIVGSKEAVEGRIVGHIIADVIEAKTDLNVERRMGLGGTMIAFQALETDEIDVYPEYTGTLLSTVLDHKFTPGTSSDEVYDLIQSRVYAENGLYTLEPYGINNTYVLAVTKETAQQYDLKTMSDLAEVSQRLTLGCTPEFAVREDGLLGINKTYGTEFKDTLNFSGTLMYTAADAGEVDVITAFSTDSLVAKYDLVVLEDNRNFFPPYHLFPLVNEKVYKSYPEVVVALDSIAALLDDDTMRRLNGLVVEKGLDASEVARQFLIEEGIL